MPFSKKEDPLPNMSRFNNDKTRVESGNKLTIEDWEILTNGWSTIYVGIAQNALNYNSIRRGQIAEEYKREAKSKKLDEEATDLIVDIYRLNDHALQQLVAALVNNQRAGKLVEPPKKR